MARFGGNSFESEVRPTVEAQLARCRGLARALEEAGVPRSHPVLARIGVQSLIGEISADPAIANRDTLDRNAVAATVRRALADGMHALTVVDKRITRVAEHRLRDRTAAEEVVGATGLSLHRTISGGNHAPITSPFAYALGALGHHVIDYFNDPNNNTLPLSALSLPGDDEVLDHLPHHRLWDDLSSRAERLLRDVAGGADVPLPLKRRRQVLGQLTEREGRALAYWLVDHPELPSGMTDDIYRQQLVRGFTRVRLLIADLLNPEVRLDALASSAAEHMRELREAAWQHVDAVDLERWLGAGTRGQKVLGRMRSDAEHSGNPACEQLLAANLDAT